jgi:large subunit ribosomal protein L3
VLGFEEIPGARSNKALLGFFKKLQAPVYRFIREFRGHEAPAGQDVGVAQFSKGEALTVEGVSIGKGWAGTIKRWNFSRGRQSHGGNFNRAPGSCGMHTWPARTIPGKKMPGRMGSEYVTLKSVEVVDVIPEENLLLLKGSVPGGEQSLLKICTSKHQKKKAA